MKINGRRTVAIPDRYRPEPETRFWIIWNPAHPMPPTTKFRTYTEARDGAERMAQKFSGARFYVCEAAEYYETERVARKTLCRF